MKIPVIIEPRAKADLRHAVIWWSEHRSGEQALRWYDGIRDAIATLADNPHRCILARENPKSDEELRELHFGLGSRPTHRAIFVIDPDAVRVLAVRHAAQDDWNPVEK
jgi:plasmid stabilization system protein ParE